MIKKTNVTLFALLIAFVFTYFMVVGIQARNESSTTDPLFTSTPQPTHMPDDLARFLSENQPTNQEGTNIFYASSPVRGVAGDLWADVVIGQPSFGQITPNQVVGNRVFNPGGVFVDRSTNPNRVYVYDAGNSRILGFSSLGSCSGGVKNGQDKKDGPQILRDYSDLGLMDLSHTIESSRFNKFQIGLLQ